MAVAQPVPRLAYLPVSTPTAAAASLRRLGAAGSRSLSGSLYTGSGPLQVCSAPSVDGRSRARKNRFCRSNVSSCFAGTSRPVLSSWMPLHDNEASAMEATDPTG